MGDFIFSILRFYKENASFLPLFFETVDNRLCLTLDTLFLRNYEFYLYFGADKVLVTLVFYFFIKMGRLWKFKFEQILISYIKIVLIWILIVSFLEFWRWNIKWDEQKREKSKKSCFMLKNNKKIIHFGKRLIKMY